MNDYLRTFLTRETLGQLLRVGLIGGFNTVVYFLLFNLFKFPLGMGTVTSVALAFMLATGLSYA
ncbi:MAG: hypothetical protein ACRDVM_06010, partial [Acidimicrobiia bacterium]